MARVLVIDDHADTVALFVEELREAGHEVSGAENPNDGLMLALQTRPDVIVLDLAMPGIDGYELATLLRSYSPTRSTPLIAVSAHPFDGRGPTVPPGGWDYCASKPVEPGTLTQLLRAVLDQEPRW